MPIEPDAMNGLKLNFLLSKKPFDARHCLVREVAADHARVGDGVVGLTDLRVQQQLHIEHRKCREDHEVGRLLPFDSR